MTRESVEARPLTVVDTIADQEIPEAVGPDDNPVDLKTEDGVAEVMVSASRKRERT